MSLSDINQKVSNAAEHIYATVLQRLMIILGIPIIGAMVNDRLDDINTSARIVAEIHDTQQETAEDIEKQFRVVNSSLKDINSHVTDIRTQGIIHNLRLDELQRIMNDSGINVGVPTQEITRNLEKQLQDMNK